MDKLLNKKKTLRDAIAFAKKQSCGTIFKVVTYSTVFEHALRDTTFEIWEGDFIVHYPGTLKANQDAIRQLYDL